jgi:hypothetical protein
VTALPNGFTFPSGSSRLRGKYPVSGRRQKPCTSARGSLKIKTKILCVFVVKNAPQISATKHKRTDIFIQNIFQNVAQLPSEQTLCASTI